MRCEVCQEPGMLLLAEVSGVGRVQLCEPCAGRAGALGLLVSVASRHDGPAPDGP